MVRDRAYHWQPSPSTRHRIWPMQAVRDARQPPARSPDEMFLLENCYAQDTEVGPLIVGRPGFRLLGTAASGSGQRLGDGANRRVQLYHQFTKRAGTEFSICICGGRLYTYNWGTNVWSEPVTAANFATASITVSATSRWSAVTFADTVVFTDGVNIPFTWDGTSGAGGLVSLTNAAVAYGPPTVYFAKLFFIKNAARGTFIWSEEGQPNTGYEAGGHNKAWDFVQTATEGLEAIKGTNDALYVFLANSASAILGAVTTDFKTSGTLPALSPNIGTRSPWSVTVTGTQVVFQDQYGFLQAAKVGEGVHEIGSGARERLRTIPALNLAVTQAIDDVETGHLKFAMAVSGSNDANLEIWLNRDDGRYAGMMQGYTLTRLGVLKDSSGVPTVVHGGGANSSTAIPGYSYAHGHPDGDLWNDGFQVGEVAISHDMESPFAGHDTEVDKLFTRGEISLLPVTTLSGASIGIRTPYGAGTSMVLETITITGVVLGVFLLGTDSLAAGSDEETKRTFGMRERGRWARLSFTHGTLNERIKISELALVSTPVTRRPEAP